MYWPHIDMYCHHLYCHPPPLSHRYTGEMGVVAVFPMIAFFGFGVLNKASACLCFMFIVLSQVVRHRLSNTHIYLVPLQGSVCCSARSHLACTIADLRLSHTWPNRPNRLTSNQPPNRSNQPQDDFNGFLWNVVMLAMGGSALGAQRPRSLGCTHLHDVASSLVMRGRCPVNTSTHLHHKPVQST